MTKCTPFDRIKNDDCKNGFCSDDAAVAQSVERRIGSAEVTGPIPVSSSEKVLVLQGLFLLLTTSILNSFSALPLLALTCSFHDLSLSLPFFILTFLYPYLAYSFSVCSISVPCSCKLTIQNMSALLPNNCELYLCDIFSFFRSQFTILEAV